MIAGLLLLALVQQAGAPGTGTDGDASEEVRAGAETAALSIRAPDGDPLTPESFITVPGGPRVARLSQPGSELVALRVAVPVREDASEAGAARLMQLVATEAALGRAAGAGVSFEGSRTPWGVAYTAVGARSDFDLLASLIREAVAEPRSGELEFERQRQALRAEVLRAQETPPARVAAELRDRAVPGSPPLEGTLASVDRLTHATLRDLWARTHRAEAMTMVVAGNVSDEMLFAAFQDMGAPGGAPSTRQGGAEPRAPSRGTQVLRHWYGEAFPILDPRDPHAAVAAVLASEELRAAADGLEGDVQLWELEGVKVLAVIAAAYPGSAVRMRGQVRALVGETRQGLTEDRVERAVSRVRQDLLQQARTPGGLVTVVGRHLEATGEPRAGRDFVAALDHVTLVSARAFLGRLEAQTPIRSEVRP